MDNPEISFRSKLLKYGEIVILGAAIGTGLFLTCRQGYSLAKGYLTEIERSVENMYRP
ncbi:MAG: hypothetical protein JW754_02845 [Candidatus Aenigmarchaeota archaeon]|nr:hypothetical protein [Candidatus Aenigmarchaeota archaeon]